MHMALPNNPLVCKVALVFNRDTRTFVNTFHVTDTAGWDAGKMSTLASNFYTWWNSYYSTGMNSSISLVQIQVRLLDPSNPLAVDYTTGLPVSGAIAGTPEAANVTNTLSWRTGLAGRKYRGRTYVPAIDESQATAGDTTTGATGTLFSIIASHFLTILTSGTQFPSIFHLATNTFTQIVGYVIESVLDSQRRRLPNRGR